MMQEPDWAILVSTDSWRNKKQELLECNLKFKIEQFLRLRCAQKHGVYEGHKWDFVSLGED